MGLTATADIDQEKYGKLLAKTLPKIIETDEEFDRMAALLEELTIPERELTPEEDALANLIEKLVVDYDDRYYAIPDAKPHEMVKFLMEQRDLKQADLVPVLGSRAQVSDLVNGKRGISKAQARKLAEFFGVSVELFI
ncbi:Transcriptional regulator, XRE family [Candidatus Sulfopaludibacter sp. SbA4]|nr:Transcriptional regulator, XRE family [Candidatus Sulfopaludibacter sp. SbA4]